MKKLLYFTLITSLLIFGCNSNKNKTNAENNKLLRNDTLTKKSKNNFKTNVQIKEIEQNEFTNEQIDNIKSKLQFSEQNTLDTLFRLNSAVTVAVNVLQEEDDGGSDICISTTYWFNTLDINLNILNQIKMDEYRDYKDGGNNFYYRILGDTLLEIQQNSNNDNNSKFDYNGPKWIYYSIDNQGKLTEIKLNRRYAFTKFVEMNEKHPFINYIIDKGIPGESEDIGPSHGILELHSGFSSYELDYMRNEIFADYGYKFKSEKWQKEFSKQKWYKPLFDNVDDSLTTIEMKNIAFILKKKSELKKEIK